MIEVCVDASVAVKWAIRGEPHRAKASALLQEARAKRIRLIAPLHFASEIDSAISKRIFYGTIARAEAQRAYSFFDSVPVQVVDVAGVRQLAREIAEDFDQQFVYDSWYAALAGIRGCDFWTADRAFFEAVYRDLSFVKYLPDYSGLDVT